MTNNGIKSAGWSVNGEDSPELHKDAERRTDMATKDRWEIYGREWLRTLQEIEDGVDPADPQTAMTTFERNIKKDLESMLDETGDLTPHTMLTLGIRP